VFRVGIVERIAHLRHTIGAVRNVKGCIALLEVFRKWLSVCGWLQSLRFVRVQLEDILPLNLDTITIR
jgi:hypothetical protein